MLVFFAQALAAPPDEAIRQTEVRRFAAMVAADTAALAPMLADDLTYTHSTGKVQTKTELLGALATGALDYLALEPQEQHVRVLGRLAIVSGLASATVRTDGQERALALRYTDVYVRRGGAWQLTAWQSTTVP